MLHATINLPPKRTYSAPGRNRDKSLSHLWSLHPDLTSVLAPKDLNKFPPFYTEQQRTREAASGASHRAREFRGSSSDVDLPTREAEDKSKEAERRAKMEADRREAIRKKNEEAEQRKLKARADAERKAKEEADRKAKAKAEADRKVKEEAEQRGREEANRIAKEEAERKAKADADRRAKEEADRKAKEEAERKAKEEADRKAMEEADQKAKEEADLHSSNVGVRSPSPPAALGEVTDHHQLSSSNVQSEDDEILEQMRREAAESSLASSVEPASGTLSEDDNEDADEPRGATYSYETAQMRGIRDRSTPKYLSDEVRAALDGLCKKCGQPPYAQDSTVSRYSREYSLSPSPERPDTESSKEQIFGELLMQRSDSQKREGSSSWIAQRRLGAGQPELHLRVLAVLNKVTAEKDKYREVKNELFRLPLAGADAAQLGKIMSTFFEKAVREPEFSGLYAQLFAEICRVPPGQLQTGDIKQSFAFRLRHALLSRCQSEFEKPLKQSPEALRGLSGEPLSAEEKEEILDARKKVLVANMKFVGELVLRKVVSASIVRLVVLQLLFGTNSLEAIDPSVMYTPEIYEFDVLVALLKTVGEFFWKTKYGESILPVAMSRIQYFQRFHEKLRIRYIMLDLLEMQRHYIQSPKPVVRAPQPVESGGSLADRFKESAPDPAKARVPERNEPTVARTSSGIARAGSHEVRQQISSPLPVAVEPRRGASLRASPPPPSARMQASTESVTTFMKNSSKRPIQTTASDFIATFSDPVKALRMWITRVLTTLRCEAERNQLPFLLAAIASSGHAASATDLYKIVLDVFSETIVKPRMYEETPRLWKCWASFVAAGSRLLPSEEHPQVVVNQNMHNTALQTLIRCRVDVDVIRKFIIEVLSQNSSQKEPLPVCVQNEFARFRFLPILAAREPDLDRGGARMEYARAVLDDSELLQKDVEVMSFFHSTMGCSRNPLFEFVRNHQQLRLDSSMCAKILCAALSAGIAAETAVAFEVLRDVLHVAVDGPDRHARERIAMCEMYYTGVILSPVRIMGSAFSNIQFLRKAGILSTETVDLVRNMFKDEPQAVVLLGSARLASRIGPSSSPPVLK